MEVKIIHTVIISTILGAALGFSMSYVTFNSQIQSIQTELSSVSSRLLQMQEFSNKTVHTFTLHWDLSPIPSGSKIEGYVKNWTTTEAIRIVQVDVWMGNPYNITWEGDVFITLNNTADLWNPSNDEVLIHYQFDSHASSPLPHLLSFDLRPGFHVGSSKTLYVYRLFNNFDEKDTTSGDGWIRLYYI